MRAPEFWRHDGPVARLLAPLGWAYGAASGLRMGRSPGWRAPVPVVCVGNLIAGGAGKTPVALDIGRRLGAAGLDVHFLSRGYGGRLGGPVRVDPAHHTARDVGDEPLLLSRLAPCWIARDRCAGARAAASAGANIIVMDDGFQNPALAKNLSVVVIDGPYGFGNGRLLPAGPLREAVNAGLGRADAVIVVGEDRWEIAAGLPSRLPTILGRLVPAPGSEEIAGRRVLAFAGIGRPGKFFSTLEEMGCDLVDALPFPDHHGYRASEIMSILESAAAAGAMVVTTAKDAVRLPAEAGEMVTVLHVTIEWEDDDRLTGLLRPVVADARGAARA